MTPFYTYPEGFPFTDLTEIRLTVNKLTTKLHSLFSYRERFSVEMEYPNWENNAKLKIAFIINKFGDKEILGFDLFSIIKDFKEGLILNAEDHNKYNYVKKIDIFPFLNFVDEQLSKIKEKKEQSIPFSFTDNINLPEEIKSHIKEDVALINTISQPTEFAVNKKINTIDQIIIDSNPAFSTESLLEVYNILKVFFDTEKQTELETLLRTGKCNNKPLVFKDNGNRLTDAFKKLKENDLITGCEKQDLEKWIGLNFNYISRKTIKAFTPDYLEKCISRKDTICKNPLFEIVNGKIIRK